MGTDGTNRNMTLHLPAHGVAALLLNDAGPEPASLDDSCAVYYQCSVSRYHESHPVLP